MDEITRLLALLGVAGIVVTLLAGFARWYNDEGRKVRRGLKVFRKHLASYVEQAPWPADLEARREARGRLCRLESPTDVEQALIALWTDPGRRLAA